MRTLISVVILIVCFCSVAAAQYKPSAPTPEVQRLDSQSAPEVAEAQRQAAEEQVKAEAAKARSESANLKFLALLYKWMADRKLSTKEWQIKQEPNGGIYLERVPPATSAPSKP